MCTYVPMTMRNIQTMKRVVGEYYREQIMVSLCGVVISVGGSRTFQLQHLMKMQPPLGEEGCKSR